MTLKLKPKDFKRAKNGSKIHIDITEKVVRAEIKSKRKIIIEKGYLISILFFGSKNNENNGIKHKCNIYVFNRLQGQCWKQKHSSN